MSTELNPGRVAPGPDRRTTAVAVPTGRLRRPLRRAVGDLLEELSILGQFAFGREYGVGSSR